MGGRCVRLKLLRRVALGWWLREGKGSEREKDTRQVGPALSFCGVVVSESLYWVCQLYVKRGVNRWVGVLVVGGGVGHGV